ncbi:tail fiber protein [Pedobacter gandavensis]|uniref:phage tail protein n=1 Tax=Pedobacter gandavensis TaxID=2679963 RepID=UPI00247B2CAA|nr:tail fiber protein [Pedobacter gandavensis]WGQ11286.1 tail fiber protein [Pedobacter gandavensis]
MDRLIGNIFMFGGNFAITDTLSCEGQILSIADNTALFSIIGTSFGGDGQTTFALPNLKRRCPIGAGRYSGQDDGQFDYQVGSSGGQEMVSLLTSNLPAHDHDKKIQAAINTGGSATTATVQGSLPANTNTTTSTLLYSATAGAGLMAPMDLNLAPTTLVTGNSMAHGNMQPYLTVNFLIVITGIFPSRN